MGKHRGEKVAGIVCLDGFIVGVDVELRDLDGQAELAEPVEDFPEARVGVRSSEQCPAFRCPAVAPLRLGGPDGALIVFLVRVVFAAVRKNGAVVDVEFGNRIGFSRRAMKGTSVAACRSM